MFIYFTLIIACFTGCLILFIINTKYRFLSHINKYLQIVIGIASLRFFLYGIRPFINDEMNRAIVLLLHAIGPISVPCIYLYFKALLDDKNTLKKNYRHFIIPLLLSLLFFVTFLTHNDHTPLYYSLFGTSMVFLNIFYCVNIYAFLKKHIWGVKNELKSLESHQKTIYNWTLFLFLAFCLITARFAILLAVQRLGYDPMASPRSLWLSALVWLMIFIKLLLTPEILYGYEIIFKKMEAFPARDFVLDMVWTVAGNQEITNLKDQKLTEKMQPALHPLIRKIEDFSLLNDFFRNADATIEDLAKELNVPASHVTYLFKYHCKESFADFKKIIRIQDAIKLLKSGFHSSHTLESLATEVGFTSYPTFFNSFKSITGKSPQEYISNI